MTHVSGATTNKLLWSSRNQLTGVVAAVTGSFAYDGVGRRITRTVSGTTEKYLYDGLNVIQQLDSSAVDRCDYFRGPLRLVLHSLHFVTLTESGGKTEVTEGGASDTYQVVLEIQPGADVTVALVVPNQLTTDKTNLTFTTANWNAVQTVTVSAVDDQLDEGLHFATITHATTSSDPGYDGLTVPDVVVSITDNDKAGVTVTESGGKTEVTEGGATDTYQVVLATQPAADVTVTLTVSSQLTTDKTNLTFTTANWNAAQTVTVSAVDDSLDEGLHFATITHATTSTDPGYDGLTVADVVVSITDNDKAGVTVTESGGKTEVTEGGVTDTYQVVLATQPAADVTVTLTVSSQLTTDKTNLTFTTANWNAAQTVTVSAVDDAIVEGPHMATLTQTATSGDSNYNGVPVADVVVSITDNDTPTRIIGLSGNLAFGSVTTGTTATATLTITNSGNAMLNVTGISYPTGFTGAWSGSISAGSSHDVVVTFAPVAVTSYGGTVTVNSDMTSGTSTISASGMGTAVPTLTAYYRDADGDGYGKQDVTTNAVSPPFGYVLTSGDCNDSDSAVHPGASEICDGIDNNCNGQVDEGVKTVFYRDADGDGHGDPDNNIQTCSAPAGYVTNGTDCDDTNPAVHPGAAEVCDGIDNNCNGIVNEGCPTNIHEMAVIAIKAPRKVTLSAKSPSTTKLVRVQIQNLGPSSETITNYADLVALVVESVGSSCTNPVASVHSGAPNKPLPNVLAPKKKLTIAFDVTFDCANDALKGVGHEDFSYLAVVGQLPDSHPEDDECPRPPNPATGDKGCGGKNPDGSLGGDVLTDVLVK